MLGDHRFHSTAEFMGSIDLSAWFDRGRNDSSSKGSSSVTPSIAPEFQEAMEKYFKAIED